MERFQNNNIERILRLLDDEIRSRGYGTIRAVDRALGFQAGWWQNRVKSGEIAVSQLLNVLSYLGIDPVRFLRDALCREGLLELDQPRGEPPALVQRALQRSTAGKEGKGLGLKWIETLDEQRFSDPAETLRVAEWAVDFVELELLPRFLGVVGSAWRLSLHLNQADHAIQSGIRIASRQRDFPAQGNLLQRLSYVVGDRGSYSEALRMCEAAAIYFLRSGARLGTAKALTDQGVWLSRLGRSQDAIETMKAALESLPCDERRYRFAASQVMGLNFRQQGQLEEALSCCVQAEQEISGLGPWDRGKLLWLKAGICADLGDLDDAQDLFQEVVETFRSLHHGETALATCELVRIQLLRKQHASAFATAISMTRLLEPLRHNEVISAAIGDLLRSGQAGLTLALVEKAKLQIESERASRGWLSSRVES